MSVASVGAADPLPADDRCRASSVRDDLALILTLLLGTFADAGHRAVAASAPTMIVRRRGIADTSPFGVSTVDAAQMRMVGEIGHGVDLGKGDVGIRQPLQQLVARSA